MYKIITKNYTKFSIIKLFSIIFCTEHIDKDAKFVLINAVYFKTRWLYIFDEKYTEEQMFHASKTKKYLVPTMFKHSIYKYGTIQAWRCRFIEIPYLASNYHSFKNFHE